MPLPRYHNRVPIELNLNSNIEGHVPAYNAEYKLWFTVPSSSFLPEGAISSSEQIIIGETSGDQFAPDRDFTFQQSLTINQNLFVGNDADINGNLNVDGRITAREFFTQIVSSSIIYQGGSTQFGDTGDDRHSFTGSLFVVGPASVESTLVAQNDLEVNGILLALGPTRLGTSAGHSHIITGSLLLNGDAEFNSNITVLGSSNFGTLLTDTHLFTGSLLVNGNAAIDTNLTVSGSTQLGISPADTNTLVGTTNLIGDTNVGVNASSVHSYTGSVVVDGTVTATAFVGPILEVTSASFASSIGTIFAGIYQVGSQIPIRK